MDAQLFQAGQRLPLDFYLRTDVLQVARDLLGKVLVTELDGGRTAVRITETEAYRAPDDRASHAWGNRRTPRTEVMFQEGGRAYIYLCYGIHQMFNVVSGPEGEAHAVLLRAAEPLEGLELMCRRRNIPPPGKLTTATAPARLTTGPGALAQALGLTTAWTGRSFFDPATPFWIEDRDNPLPETAIAAGPRIGIDYAGESAAWEWRFWVRESRFVKR